jgi:phosphate uptake regulator
MERQLVQHGKSTVMVSLPKKWIDQQKLGKGDSITIIPVENKIVITPAKRNLKEKEITIHLDADYEQVRAELGTLYRKGYEKITVTFDHPRTMYFIQLMANALYGFEIIEQTENRCILKSMVKELEVDTNQVKNKIINIIKTEFNLVRDYLEKGTKGKCNELQIIRDDCWKFRNLIYVYLREHPMFSGFNTYFLIHLFEYNASFLFWLYRSFDKSSITHVSKEFLSLFDKVRIYFDDSIKKLKEEEHAYIEFIQINRDKLLKDCEEYTLKNTKDRFLVLYLSMLVQNIHNPKSIII